MNRSINLKNIGPGLIFASSAIGTSHLVLATRAGAHHGLIFFWIILLALILKYPFYEYGSRYASATGYSLLKGYRDQGKWAVYLFLAVIGINMFAVTAAIAAVSAGLLSSIFKIDFISVKILSGLILLFSSLLLFSGGYKLLDRLVKLISFTLLICITIAFIAVLTNGPAHPSNVEIDNSILSGAGLALLTSLLGWMPAGMEASTMNSIWTIEKIKSTHYHPTRMESLLDFNIGYMFTSILAIMFMVIGAYTLYGSGIKLEGNATQFSVQLIDVFVSNIGGWSYYIISIAAFGTIYGTLIAVLDAFPRCVIRGLRVLKFELCENNKEQNSFLEKHYKSIVTILATGSFLLFYFSTASMIQLLQLVTILSFLLSPIIAWLNLKAVSKSSIPEAFKPGKAMMVWSYLGLSSLILFSLYYLYELF